MREEEALLIDLRAAIARARRRRDERGAPPLQLHPAPPTPLRPHPVGPASGSLRLRSGGRR